ncbi:MAG: glycosyltransferase family 4 protein [Candidatus Moranbacteria bacterium]|jgi:glycosyltransferase involved in cell wall biosynthesis|nr:glycosyltransferase family 4 protein [Candidatus Moranbacteria bacterium]MBP9801692.1 glycosyltransferase family 4 protein [Candidatus Moranbacteria bacterium]
MTKVLFFNYEYPPLGGGAANATAYLLAEFAQMPDIEVHLITSAVGSDEEKGMIGNNVHIYRLPIGKKSHNLHRQSVKDIAMYSWKSFFFARRLVVEQKESFDITLAFFGVPCGFVAYLLKRCFHIPYIVAMRGSDVPGYNEKYTFLYVFLKPVIRFIWKKAARVVSNSEGLRTLALATSPSQHFDIIPNGVDTKQFFPAYEKRPQEEYIVTPGASRITDRKGLKYLIQAIALLLPRYPMLRLKILGDGSGRASLEKLVRDTHLEEKVTFVGRVPREETRAYYQEASVFVLPSLNEGMSNALLEALACGLPIITTQTGGTKELVEDGKNGILVPFRSAQKIADALETYLLHQEQAQNFGRDSRRRAEACNWQQVAVQFKVVLESQAHR